MLDLHRTMVRIRVFEERVQQLFLARKLPGFVHVYLGEEAVAAGVCAACAATTTSRRPTAVMATRSPRASASTG